MLHESITKVANLVVHDGTYTVGATHMHVHGQQLQQATFEVAHATHVGSSEDCRCVQFVWWCTTVRWGQPTIGVYHSGCSGQGGHVAIGMSSTVAWLQHSSDAISFPDAASWFLHAPVEFRIRMARKSRAGRGFAN